MRTLTYYPPRVSKRAPGNGPPPALLLCLTLSRPFGRLKVQKGGWFALRFLALVLISLCAVTAFAQESPSTPVPAESAAANPNPFVTLASSFFDHDYFNFYAFTDGVYDSYAPVEQNGKFVNGGTFGWDVGGGLSGRHTTEHSSFTISYRGDYRDYSSGFYSSGTDQFLDLAYTTRFTRRLSMSVSVDAGNSVYATGLYAPAAAGQVIPSNPFSADTRFASTGVSFIYQQTRRLSYIVGGSFFLQRYNYPGSIGITGESGSASVQYRLSSRTTVGGSYSYSYFGYQAGAGNASTNSFSGTLSRTLPARFSVNLYAGVSQTSANGITAVPVTLIVGGQAVGGYVIGPYHQSASLPSFGGSLSKNYRRTVLSVGAGQGISAGNGYYLASRSDFITGSVSYGLRNSALSAAGSYTRLSSIANTVSSTFTTGLLAITYSRVLMHYVSGNLSYNYLRYSSLSPFPGISDNRLSFGISFSSKSVPLTVF